MRLQRELVVVSMPEIVASLVLRARPLVDESSPTPPPKRVAGQHVPAFPAPGILANKPLNRFAFITLYHRRKMA